MNSFEYAMALISIVLALAIGDIATSLHKLIRHRTSIRWDARVLWAAGLAFVTVFNRWFDLWGVHGRADILSYPFLLSLVIELLLLFVMATTVLPDDPVPDTDLRNFYDETSRSLWAFYLLFQISYFGHWLYFAFTTSYVTPALFMLFLPQVLVPTVAAALLTKWPRHRRLHLVVVPLLVAFSFYIFMDASLA